MRIALLCRYDGSNYHGFQIQPNNNTIQEEIEKSLKKINKKDVRLYMSGRTDSGVHAYGQVLHFDTDLNIPDIAWVKALNATIPKDIRIVGATTVSEDFHVRYNSTQKTYYYKLYCPEQGAFIAYKKGLNNRIIKLLIPSDSKRVSSTRNCCRCDKAKVLEIKNFEGTIFYDEAWSTVAEDFCYKLGEWVYAGNFNEDRWYDSTGGIHFWMTEEEAKKY